MADDCYPARSISPLTATWLASNTNAPRGSLDGDPAPQRERLGFNAQSLAGGRIRAMRRLGAGGMGVVYEAFDAQRQEHVALKALCRLDGASLYRFKHEFRASAALRHPNLVPLYELFADEDRWFFTMALIRGVHWDEWVRPEGRVSIARLRRSLLAMSQAVACLHDAGKVHRDLKPSNVMIAHDETLLVLDFGLLVETAHDGNARNPSLASIAGTPAYMAPEQGLGGSAVQASDLYAIGVMLFEALTGRLPFDGGGGDVLCEKQRSRPTSVFELGERVPRDLGTLCMELLAREPSARPDVSELEQRLIISQHADCSSARSAKRLSARPLPGFFGRQAELTMLRDAFDAAARGQPTVVELSGPSGIGKTALCHMFLRELRGEGRASVLCSRCCERENVPFKALDPLIDDLTRQMRKWSPQRAAAALPRDVFALARMFPVLERVSVVADAPAREVSSLRELRRLALEAFLDLLYRLRDRGPLVLHMDDLQWLDSESEPWLRALLSLPTPPPLLLIISHRAQSRAQNPLLSSVLGAAVARPDVSLRRISLGPLAPAAAAEMAQSLLAQTSATAPRVDAIARESGGSPFFITVLSRAGETERSAAPRSLEAVLGDRIAAQTLPARRLLELLALAASPLPIQAVLRAADATGDCLDALEQAQLIRTGAGHVERTVEPYHDRIASAALATLDAGTRSAHYQTLAAVLERGETAPELLLFCHERAGNRSAAARHALRAADDAVRIAGFERGAALYTRALTLGLPEPEARRTRIKLADTLAWAGRGRDAAAIYVQCAAGERDARALDMRRNAAELLLISGAVDDGAALLSSVCADAGLPLPSHPGHALARLLANRARQRLRVARPSEAAMRPNSALSPLERVRLEVARSAVCGLATHRPLSAAAMSTRYLELALKAEEPGHIAVAVGFEAYYQSLARPAAGKRAMRYLSEADLLAERCGQPETRAFVAVVRGNIAYNQGRFVECASHQARALQVLAELRDNAEGKGKGDWAGIATTFGFDCAQLFDQLASFACGRFADLVEKTPLLIDDALMRGRTWVVAIISSAAVPAWLARDDVAGLERYLDSIAAFCRSGDRPHWSDFNLMLARGLLSLYQGDPLPVVAEFERAHSAVERKLLRFAAVQRIWWHFHRGGAAIAAMRKGIGQRRELYDIARKSAASLARETLAFGTALHHVLAAGLSLVDEQRDQAAAQLLSAVSGFDAAQMTMYAAAARRRWGQLIEGTTGTWLLQEGTAAMRAEQVVNLEAMTNMLCPGCCCDGG